MTLRLRILTIALACAGIVGSPSCVGTPLPDPPSATGALIFVDEGPQPGEVRLVGVPGAIFPGGATIRITDPPSAGVLVETDADGSFGRAIAGTTTDTFYFEQVLTDTDRFSGAFRGQGPRTHLVATSAGADADADGSPDAVDCASADPSHVGQRCPAGATCTVDSDCAAGQACVSGVCSASACVPSPELCNGLDDDCNGTIDDGDPGGGVFCAGTGTCDWGTNVCDVRTTMLVCTPGAPLPAEICSNGIDDDCNGIADDGC